LASKILVEEKVDQKMARKDLDEKKKKGEKL
jgi:hypothetical protein